MVQCLLAVLAAQRGPIDIRDLGAVGDGVTMCTAAIQKALHDAGRAGGDVLVPAGTFLTGSRGNRAVASGCMYRRDGVGINCIAASQVNAPCGYTCWWPESGKAAIRVKVVG